VQNTKNNARDRSKLRAIQESSIERIRIREEQGDNDPIDFPRVEHPNLNLSHYGILLGGHTPDAENGISEIPPIFALSFSKEKNLRSYWALCGAVPLTRVPVHHHRIEESGLLRSLPKTITSKSYWTTAMETLIGPTTHFNNSKLSITQHAPGC
jgi:hypothetical protein